jgi:hypothetical protein
VYGGTINSHPAIPVSDEWPFNRKYPVVEELKRRERRDLKHPVRAIVRARRYIRDDTNVRASIGDREWFIEINGKYYPISILLSTPGMLPDQLHIEIRNVL